MRTIASIAVTCALVGSTAAGVMLLATTGGFRPINGTTLFAAADRIAEAIGMRIAEVDVTGHRFTLDRDIYAALDLEHAGTQLSFDAAAARARIEALPWVASAVISRAFPDRIRVAITERRPAAVWRLPDHDLLVSADGRELGAAARGSESDLPVLEGEGAGPAIAEITRFAGAHEEIASRLKKSVRVGDRRWRLVLAGGLTLELPADGAEAALTRLLADLRAAGRMALLDDGLERIDLRTPGELAVHRARAPGVGRGAAGPRPVWLPTD